MRTILTGSRLEQSDTDMDSSNVLIGGFSAISDEPTGTFKTSCDCDNCCGDHTDVDLGVIGSNHDVGGSSITHGYNHLSWSEYANGGNVLLDDTYLAARERSKAGASCLCVIRVMFGKTSSEDIGMSDLILSQGTITANSVNWANPSPGGSSNHVTFFGVYEAWEFLSQSVGIEGGASCSVTGVTVGDEEFGVTIAETIRVASTGLNDPTAGYF